MKLTHSSDESSQWCFNIIENKKLLKTVDPKIEELYQTTEDNIKKMINCMKTTINEQKQFAFEMKLNLVSYSLSSSSKDIDYLYLLAMENFHEWLKTFLDKTFLDKTMPKILLSTEINGIQECRRATSILREHEQSYKIKKDKYELLCEESIKNIELLEGHNNNLSKERLINNSNIKKITPIKFESKGKHLRGNVRNKNIKIN
ncbi:hypothetical protein H8356DRAFT_1342884 [Neocallimastix lanati (nom. inval.)]|nr:hypothetical protein H8356DRAFT_1342884 [Neocallimastix sp. JGI-2020a]